MLKKLVELRIISILCRVCQSYELSASLLELESFSSTSLLALTLLPALSWMSVGGNHKFNVNRRQDHAENKKNHVIQGVAFTKFKSEEDKATTQDRDKSNYAQPPGRPNLHQDRDGNLQLGLVQPPAIKHSKK